MFQSAAKHHVESPTLPYTKFIQASTSVEHSAEMYTSEDLGRLMQRCNVKVRCLGASEDTRQGTSMQPRNKLFAAEAEGATHLGRKGAATGAEISVPLPPYRATPRPDKLKKDQRNVA